MRVIGVPRPVENQTCDHAAIKHGEKRRDGCELHPAPPGLGRDSSAFRGGTAQGLIHRLSHSRGGAPDGDTYRSPWQSQCQATPGSPLRSSSDALLTPLSQKVSQNSNPRYASVFRNGPNVESGQVSAKGCERWVAPSEGKKGKLFAQWWKVGGKSRFS